MVVPSLCLLMVLLFMDVNGGLSYKNMNNHKQHSVKSSHDIKHTEARFNHPNRDSHSQHDNTNGQDAEHSQDMDGRMKVAVVEQDEDIEISRLINPSVPIVEPFAMKSSVPPDRSIYNIELLHQRYSGGIKVLRTSVIKHVDTWKLACDIKQLQHGEIKANCSSRQLQSVPKNLPTNITELDLSRNSLTYLADNGFKMYSNLTVLNLNFNKICRVDIRSFAGLFKLTTLYLAGNKLKSTYTSMPSGLFSDVYHLKTLIIEQNDFYEYPDWIFHPLKHLEKLSIDSDQSYPLFGPGFQHLKNLTFLQMDSRYFDGDCKIERLGRDTFRNLQNSSVKWLVINKCNDLMVASKDVFQPLSSLSVLELSTNQLGIQQALETLQPFDRRIMSSVTMDYVGIEYTDNAAYYKSLVLTNNTLQFLVNICISEISFRQNGIVWLEDIWNGTLISKCITKIDFSGNELKGDGFMLVKLSIFKLLSDFRIGMDTSLLKTNYLIEKNDTYSDGIEISLQLPPRLEYLDLTGRIGGDLEVPFIVSVTNTKNLTVFKFAYNTIIKHLRGFRGLEHVITIDLSGQTAVDKKGILGSFPGTEDLTLTFNNLKFISQIESKEVFQNLQCLRYINLSHNNLRSVPLLPNPTLVKTINLAYNEINTLPTLWDFTNLTLIDVSNNLIGQIDGEVREFLDHAHCEQNMMISVLGNPFLCDCENVDFIVWLVESEVIYETQRTFPCMKEKGIIANAKEVADRYYIEMRPCNGKLILAFTVILLIVLIMAIVITYFLGRNLTRFQNFIMKILGFGVRFLTPFDFEFTFYVGYCQDDVPFVFRVLRPALEKGNTRVFLHDRDVLPGVPIANGIIDGVTRSWKVLLVVSDEFLADPWSDFVISTALYAMTDLIPDRIRVLLVGGVQVEELPEVLLCAVDEKFILCADQFEGDQLWVRLKEGANIE